MRIFETQYLHEKASEDRHGCQAIQIDGRWCHSPEPRHIMTAVAFTLTLILLGQVHVAMTPKEARRCSVHRAGYEIGSLSNELLESTPFNQGVGELARRNAPGETGRVCPCLQVIATGSG